SERLREAGFDAAALGPRILRAETAAIAAVTALQVLWCALAKTPTSDGNEQRRRRCSRGAVARLLYSRDFMFLLGQAVGKYQILSNLGSGGFGTVFLAKDAWIDKKVAIKVPHRQSGAFADRLEEPRLLAALDHPNIVGIVTAERVEGVFFIVMDYIKGESLEAVLDREKSLDLPRALNYIVQLLKGVEHAHQAQILHRDLRPAEALAS